MDEIISGKYRILEKIGEGGMGTVYRALQIDVERVVALKMLSPFLAGDPSFLERFRQEALVIARLSHPSIVNVIGIEQHVGTFCIVMEFIDGETLESIMNRRGALERKQAVDICRRVAGALEYAHSKGIVHRDIKPDNIMVMPDGGLKVTDFGLARWSGSSLKTDPGISMGTPKFMSPEQATGEEVDNRSDLYSLGLVLYYLLTGRFAFDSHNAAEMALLQQNAPLPPSVHSPDLPPAVDAFFKKCLEPQRGERFQNAREMIHALEGIAGEKPPPGERKKIRISASPKKGGQATEIRRDPRFDIPTDEKSSLTEKKRFTYKHPILFFLLLVLTYFIAEIIMMYRRDRNEIQRGGQNEETLLVTPSPTIAPVNDPSISLTPTPARSPSTPGSDARNFYNRAVTLRDAPGSDPDEIRRYFILALDRNRDFYEALRDYGLFLYDQKDYNRAGDFLRQALQRCDNESDRSLIQSRIASIHNLTKRP